MDEYGQLPLTLALLEARLCQGQVFTIRYTGSFDYALSLDEQGRITLRQGSQDQTFRQLEPAVLTLLNCLGEFSSSSTDRGEEAQAES